MSLPSLLADALNPDLWIVTAGTIVRPAGLVATSVMNVSITPVHPRYVVVLAKSHITCQAVLETKRIGLHLIDKNLYAWVARFGLTHGNADEKFDGLAVNGDVQGTPYLSEAMAWGTGPVIHTLDIVDRYLFVVRLEHQQIRSGTPLNWNSYAQLAPREIMARLEQNLQLDIDRDNQLLSALKGNSQAE